MQSKLQFAMPRCSDLKICHSASAILDIHEMYISETNLKEIASTWLDTFVNFGIYYSIDLQPQNAAMIAVGFKTLENKRKPLVFKDLRKIWDKYDPNLPWEKGYYNESNTLLLDDSPYKALLNPPYNSIFPHTFTYENQNDDNSLAAGGDLRQYLDELANAENVVKYVEEHPFGQEPITEKNEFWDFYLNVINSLSVCQSEK
ncbi:NLI interacting factor-like phosphatase [Trifolium pratense]|uniref:Mitochondrial import inner membrane translocase subunit TIM50 n=1 Tax=Trifolium pratense TaxID=57577 RepID=A0A2K3MCN3_TRIPR|nr:NLI interacting factor-like phosphatase [Trifolium pratense]